MNEEDREPGALLAEMAPVLSVLATRALYDEQPDLWKMGEHGRARTIEDFNHHFRALQPLNASVFRAHVEYCQELFGARGFPQRWLEDAWRWMALVIERELPPSVSEPALAVLREVTEGVEGRRDRAE